ncbi:MAG: hypothetical protein J6B98_04780 [Bacilli bacterium]|nr:hypothetical protein [Bacilli bacterium]
MGKDVEFLNYIHQNAKMGVVGIDNIKAKIYDEELKDLIATQRKEYVSICDEVTKLLNELGVSEKDISTMAKVMTYFMANLELLKDDSASNIAKLMIEGSNKGIVEITKKLNGYNNANKKVEKLAKKLLVTEQHNIDELKIYL